MKMPIPELRRRMHAMVDQLTGEMSDDWQSAGIYPLLKITVRHRDDNEDADAVTLVVGIKPPEADDDW